MNKRKKFGIILFLCCCFVFSNKLDAKLKEVYYVRENGLTTPLHSKYNWIKTNSGYLTEDEQKNKKNLSCDTNNVQFWWTYSESKCEFNRTVFLSKHTYLSSCPAKSNAAQAKNATEAMRQCKQQLLRSISGKLECWDNFGRKQTVTIKDSDLSASTSTKGVWNKSAPSVSSIWTNTGKTRPFCTWGGTTEIGTKNLVQNVYDAEGAAAYCLNPGKNFINQNYELDEKFDVSDCKDTSTYNCGLAGIVAESEKRYGADYLTTVTALRLWAAYKGSDDDAWWDSQTDTVYKNSGIYKITADYVISNGYSGDTSAPDLLGVIYAEGGSINQLQNAISLFKDAVSGNIEFWVPNTKVLDYTINKETGIVDLIVASNFDNMTKIEKITTEPEIGGITFAPETCPQNEIGDYCLKISIPVDLTQIKDSLKITGLIEYNHPNDVVTKMGLYLPSKNPSKYQYMVIFDKGVPSTAPFEFELKRPLCTFQDNKWYDRDGNETDKEGYLESCECVEVDGVKYIKYPDRPAQSEEEWYEECEKVKCPDKGIDYSEMPETCEEDGEIKDPEICNIINREDGNYKTEYGNKFCTIYCREALTFTFMDKETAIAGRYFKHDVKSKYSNIAYLSTVIKSSRQCTSLIDYDTWEKEYLAANDAVLSTWNNLKYWESLYNLNGGNPTDTQPGGGCSGCKCTQPDHPTFYAYWETGYWNQTFENGSSSVQSAAVSQIGSAASCGYWHTSCSGSGENRTCTTTCRGTCKAATSADLGYVRRNYNSAIASYEGALNRRDTLLYQLQDCNFMSKEPKGTYMDYIENQEKQDKTFYRSYQKKSFYVVGGRSYTSPVEFRTYNQVMQYEPENDVEIDYEENYTYNEGYDITTKDELTPNVVTQMGFSDQDKWEEYCSEDCDYDLRDLTGSSFTKELPYWLCSGSETGAQCVKDPKILPSNKLVNINIERESLHYQDSAFFTQVYTGHISTSGNSQGYWIPLLDDVADYHLYPVGIKRKTGSYDIILNFPSLGNQDRVDKFVYNEEVLCKYQVINDLAVYDCDDDYHTCYPCTGPDCYPEDTNKNPYDLGVYFRTIDLNDVFPNSVYSPNYNNRPQSVRPIGKNWTINNAKQIVEQIQKLNTGVWQEKPQYEITLNRETIAEIKKHNKRTNYQNYSLTCNGLSCTSDFLSNDLKEILMEKYDKLYKKDTTIKQNELYNYNR